MGVFLDYLLSKRKPPSFRAKDSTIKNSVRTHAFAMLNGLVKKKDLSLLSAFAACLEDDFNLFYEAGNQFGRSQDARYFCEEFLESLSFKDGIETYGSRSGDNLIKYVFDDNEMALITHAFPLLTDPEFIFNSRVAASDLHNYINSQLISDPINYAKKLLHGHTYEKGRDVLADTDRLINNPLFVAVYSFVSNFKSVEFNHEYNKLTPEFKAITGMMHHLFSSVNMREDNNRIINELALNKPLENYLYDDLNKYLSLIDNTTNLFELNHQYKMICNADDAYPSVSDNSKQLQHGVFYISKDDVTALLTQLFSDVMIRRAYIKRFDVLAGAVCKDMNKFLSHPSYEKVIDVLFAAFNHNQIRRTEWHYPGRRKADLFDNNPRYNIVRNICADMPLSNITKILAHHFESKFDNVTPQALQNFEKFITRLPSKAQLSMLQHNLLSVLTVGYLFNKSIGDFTDKHKFHLRTECHALALITAELDSNYPDAFYTTARTLAEARLARRLSNIEIAAEFTTRYDAVFANKYVAQVDAAVKAANTTSLDADMSFINGKTV